MNNVNQNFLEEEVEYELVPEDQITDADEVLDDVEAEIEENERQAEEALAAMSEVEKRIEQANLYKAVLNSKLFAPNSARPEIMAAVDREFKEFVRTRLEILLGIRQEVKQQRVESVFSPEEINGLKALVGRLLAKGGVPAQAQPQVQQVQTVQPKISQVQATAPASPVVQPVQASYEQSAPTSTPQQGVKMVRRVVKKTQQAAQPAKKVPARRQKSNNTATLTGEDLSQVVNPATPPRPMPTQAAMDQMNAMQAARNAGGASPSTPYSDPNSAPAMNSNHLNLALNQILRGK